LERIPPPKRLIELTDPDPLRKFKVVAIGPGVWREDSNGRWFEPTTLKPGQVVILPGSAAEQPDMEMGKDRILVMENDIGAIVG
jgi:co-chaperonin GroES (HSP10)